MSNLQKFFHRLFSKMVICGNCEDFFRRIHWNNHGCKSIVWRCSSRLDRSRSTIPCTARTVNEEELKSIVIRAINEVFASKKDYLKVLQNHIAQVVKESAAISEIEIDKHLLELQKELINKANNKEEYNSIAEEIFHYRELKQKTLTDGATRDDQVNRLKELYDFIKSQSTELTEFDESLVKRMVERIVVYDDKVCVEFKSGMTVEV